MTMTALQMELAGALVGLIKVMDGFAEPSEDTRRLFREGLTALQDPGAGEDTLRGLIDRAHGEKFALIPDCAVCASPCGRGEDYDISLVYSSAPELREAKLKLLEALTALAARGEADGEVDGLLYRGLFQVWYAMGPESVEKVLEEVAAHI